jgi:hypothetical protein
MSRRLLAPVLAAVVLATAGVSVGVLGAGSGASARTLDITKSRWANRISGYITQDLLATTQGLTHAVQAPASQSSAGVEPPTLNTYGCSQRSGDNVRANQDCTNDTVPRYAGRGQAQNETSIAVNPTNPRNLLGGQNDYRRGDGSCGADYSLDGGEHWGNSLPPIGFSVPGVDNSGAIRHYWTSSGDPSVAFDSEGAAYYDCQVFDRSFPVNDDASCANPAGSCASGIFVFRSVDGGASWNFPGGASAASGTGEVITTPGLQSQTQFTLEDKPYMGIDSHSSSPFRDRIYVAWTHYAPCRASNTCQVAALYFAYSTDHGATFSTPKNIGGRSSALCPIALNPSTPNACDNDSFADPVVAANGDLYVFYTNYNNAISGNENFNDILVVKSSDGGAHFSGPRLVSKFYDLPDCVTYTGDDAFRACVPTVPLSNISVFRATNYPSGAADPKDPNTIYATFGSFINPHSNPGNAKGHGFCAPNGLNPTTFLNLYKGVGQVNGCNNDILLSVSTDGGRTWSAAKTGPAGATPVSSEGSQLADQWWQWAATNAQGSLAVSYYDRKYGSDTSTGDNDVTLAASGDDERARTGLDESDFSYTRVTSASTPSPTQFPDMANGHGVFMGDYSGLAVSGDNAYPMWADARNIEQFQCPSSGSPLALCRVTNGSVLGQDEDVFSTNGLELPSS